MFRSLIFLFKVFEKYKIMEDETKFYIYTIIVICFYLYIRYGLRLNIDYFDTEFIFVFICYCFDNCFK